MLLDKGLTLQELSVVENVDNNTELWLVSDSSESQLVSLESVSV